MLSAAFDGNQRASAASGPIETASYYEHSASPRALYAQGARAGTSASQGIVILDFGRPAFDGRDYGMLDFANRFVSLASISVAVERYVIGYFRFAPSDTTLDVAVGTNNSCGAGQPCGGLLCGCVDEPPDYNAWGRSFAGVIINLNDWARSLAATRHFTDTVHVVAGDDAEPAFDPGFRNTYELLAGYASAIGGSSPAMVDYGSAEPNYWSESQLLQVAYGFAPDVPMPEIYFPLQVGEWVALLDYAKAVDKTVRLFGVLGATSGTPPAAAYSELTDAVAAVTGQRDIAWLSAIHG